MKKQFFNKLFIGLLAAIMLVSIAFVPAFSTVKAENEHPPRVVDDADLLTPNQETELTALLDSISEKHNVDVAIVTVNSTEGKEAEAFADDYFDYNGYGLGKKRSGVLLLRVLDPKYVHISTCGKAIKCFEDKDIEHILDAMENDFHEENYFSAFNIFAEKCEEEILKGNEKLKFKPFELILAVVVGILIALIPMKSMKNKLKTVEKQTKAEDYAQNVQLDRSEDIFLYHNVTRTKRASESSSGGSGGGSSTHTSSSGSTHGGGGRSM